jgi:hypothetical protein
MNQLHPPLDLVRQHRDEYAARKTPALVHPKPAQYLVIEGVGAGGSDTFQQRLGALYAVAYAVRQSQKKEGRAYKIAVLEGQWWVEHDHQTLMDVPKSEWHWRLLVRTPDFVTRHSVIVAIDMLRAKGKEADVEDVGLIRLEEGDCVQQLHVGPWDAEGATIEQMLAFAHTHGRRPRGHHHEIYLSDPRRVAPQRLRTILRQPVK